MSNIHKQRRLNLLNKLGWWRLFNKMQAKRLKADSKAIFQVLIDRKIEFADSLIKEAVAYESGSNWNPKGVSGPKSLNEIMQELWQDNDHEI